MGHVFAVLANGMLRSRVGAALVLAVLVLGVVGVARAFSGGTAAGSGLTGAPESRQVTLDPTAGDDGISSPEPQPSLRVDPGARAPAAVAGEFASAWINHRNVSADQWHAALLPHSTATLAGKLTGVDPVEVPADRLTGEPVVIPYSAGVVDVAIAVDSGTLRLRLVASDGRWLVDRLNWQRG